MDVRDLRRALHARLAALRAWATWTPRRAGTIAGVCVTVLVAGPLAAGVTRNALAGPEAPAATATTRPAATGTSTAPSPAPSPPATTPPADDEPALTRQEQDAAAAIARRFAELWLAGAFVPDRTRWAATMTEVVQPSLVPFLEATPASAIPRTTVQAVVPRLVAPTYGAVRVTFADGSGMDLQVSATGPTWRVGQYLPTKPS